MGLAALVVAVVAACVALVSLGWQVLAFVLPGPRIRIRLEEAFRNPLTGELLATTPRAIVGGVQKLRELGYSEHVLLLRVTNRVQHESGFVMRWDAPRRSIIGELRCALQAAAVGRFSGSADPDRLHRSARTDPIPTRYQYLDFNAPISGWRADAIAHALAESRPNAILDIGCGWGELLLRTLTAAPGAVGLGIDIDATALARARTNAGARGLASRVTFIEAPAPEAHEAADVVICLGSEHAYGGQSEALTILHRFVRPGGCLLFGSGFWKRQPSPEEAAALEAEPDSFPDLGGLVDLAINAGFRPMFIQTANQDEWEQFESGYLAGWERWLLQHPDDPEAAEILSRADAHRNGWLRGYRDVLGFAYLSLGRPVE